MRRIAKDVYWKRMKSDVRQFVAVCQSKNYDTTSSLGLLRPLPIHNTIWPDISLDFIEGLPKSHGKDVILVVVDRLSKYDHFIPMAHLFSALTVAQVFLENIYKLHRVAATMVFDTYKVFLSKLWK